MIKWLAAIFLLAVLHAGAQIKKPVKWTFSSKEVSKGVYDLTLEAHIDKGWHVFSQTPYDPTLVSPNPTVITFKNDDSAYELLGATKEKSKLEKVHDPGFDVPQVFFFENKAVFVQRIKLKKNIASVDGSVEFQTCDAHECIPPDKVKFTIALKAGTFSPANEGSKTGALQTGPDTLAAAIKPAAIPAIKPDSAVSWTWEMKKLRGLEYEVLATAHIQKGWHLLTQNVAGKKDSKAPQIILASGDSFNNAELLMPKSSSLSMRTKDNMPYTAYDSVAIFSQKIRMVRHAKTVQGVISFTVTNGEAFFPGESSTFAVIVPADTAGSAADGQKSLSAIFWLGLLGGFIALFTPCVYPMIPLTVSFFTKHSEKRSKGVRSAVIFGLSIILIYVTLGLLITLIFGANGLNNLASNVYTNLAFFVVFMIFAFSFLGAFELTLPSSWANKTDSRAERGGVIGIFFIALTLSIVSFSCTSPVIGALISFAASSGNYGGAAIGMAGFSLAWALPFSFFAMFPTLMQKLPKSGGWLNAVKVTFGFLELALALKFLSTADLTYNWGLLKREYFLALWIIIFALLGLYLLGKLKLSHDTPVAHISVPRLLLAILAFGFSLYMVPGLWGAPVRLLSGIAPPSTYSEWMRNDQGNGAEGNNTATATGGDKPHKYHDLFKSPHGINAYYDYDEAIAAARAQHKPMMIDFTGHACTNCRLMEENVWSNPTALAMLKNDYILVSLYCDDRHDLTAGEVFTSKYTHEKITDLGDKWKDLETGKYNTNALPFYILVDNNENTIGRYEGYDPDADKFIAFLKKGKESFKQ